MRWGASAGIQGCEWGGVEEEELTMGGRLLPSRDPCKRWRVSHARGGFQLKNGLWACSLRARRIAAQQKRNPGVFFTCAKDFSSKTEPGCVPSAREGFRLKKTVPGRVLHVREGLQPAFVG